MLLSTGGSSYLPRLQASQPPLCTMKYQRRMTGCQLAREPGTFPSGSALPAALTDNQNAA